MQLAVHPNSLRAMVPDGLVHPAQEPVQKGPADAMGLTGVKQPRQHVAVADLVLRVAQDIEGIELPPLRILRWYRRKPESPPACQLLSIGAFFA